MTFTLVDDEIRITASSRQANGAYNISDDGSSFSLELPRAINIPPDAIEPVISAETATIWWTTPNVVTNVNDRITITGPDNQPVPVTQTYNITIPQGLWSPAQLNVHIQTALEAAGAQVNPLPLISLSGNTATQRSTITFNYDSVTVTANQNNSLLPLLGFDSTTATAGFYGPYPAAPTTITSEGVAQISPVDYYLITCSLVDEGIRYGDQSRNIIAQIPISVPPGYQIQHEPRNPPVLPASMLTGQSITSFRCELLNHNLEYANTGGHPWSVQLRVAYKRRLPL